MQKNIIGLKILIFKIAKLQIRQDGVYLKHKLQNDFIDFSVSIDESVAQKPKTEHDIFKEMLAENEHFKRLADELAL